ncbi:MAG: tRNA pseudouridine(38-40) synthase TruA [Fusobacteriota bacterium]
MKKNIKLIFEYDGSGYFGFQRQPDKKTVQGEIEKAIKVCLKEKINLLSSGRTDRGVHATKQVSNFKIDTGVPINKLKMILNRVLPRDIRIKKVEQVDLEFHSRYLAKERGYKYILKEEKNYNIYEQRYTHYVKDEINPTKFLEIIKPLEGYHNFSSFKRNDNQDKNPYRTITMIDFYKKQDKYTLHIKGKSFLKSMIRIIVGSALEVYFGKKDKNYIIDKLKSPDPHGGKIVAPPNGLFLTDVDY